jgi:molybdopterin adenylyltransferase
MIRVAILTISDRVSKGAAVDESGKKLRGFCEKMGWNVTKMDVVGDEIGQIQSKIREFLHDCNVILTTGGTGIAARDVTPEAVREIASKELTGFGEVMRAKSFEKFPHAILSRNLAVVVEKTLVICLPGSPKAAVECLEFVAKTVPHAVDLLRGKTTEHPKH